MSLSEKESRHSQVQAPVSICRRAIKYLDIMLFNIDTGKYRE